ncbi:hypothetical protein KM043_004230 [Ampulex compressa]|nr:hypothetical protein KM043_004230 [Ampulex compressa]
MPIERSVPVAFNRAYIDDQSSVGSCVPTPHDPASIRSNISRAGATITEQARRRRHSRMSIEIFFESRIIPKLTNSHPLGVQ